MSFQLRKKVVCDWLVFQHLLLSWPQVKQSTGSKACKRLLHNNVHILLYLRPVSVTIGHLAMIRGFKSKHILHPLRGQKVNVISLYVQKFLHFFHKTRNARVHTSTKVHVKYCCFLLLLYGSAPNFNGLFFVSSYKPTPTTGEIQPGSFSFLFQAARKTNSQKDWLWQKQKPALPTTQAWSLLRRFCTS